MKDTTNKDLTNAGIAGVAVGAAVGVAATMLLSDKKRRDSLLHQAEKIKNDLVDTTLKLKDEKGEELEQVAKEVAKSDAVKAVEKKVTEAAPKKTVSKS